MQIRSLIAYLSVCAIGIAALPAMTEAFGISPGRSTLGLVNPITTTTLDFVTSRGITAELDGFTIDISGKGAAAFVPAIRSHAFGPEEDTVRWSMEFNPQRLPPGTYAPVLIVTPHGENLNHGLVLTTIPALRVPLDFTVTSTPVKALASPVASLYVASSSVRLVARLDNNGTVAAVVSGFSLPVMPERETSVNVVFTFDRPIVIPAKASRRLNEIVRLPSNNSFSRFQSGQIVWITEDGQGSAVPVALAIQYAAVPQRQKFLFATSREMTGGAIIFLLVGVGCGILYKVYRK